MGAGLTCRERYLYIYIHWTLFRVKFAQYVCVCVTNDEIAMCGKSATHSMQRSAPCRISIDICGEKSTHRSFP